MPTHDSRQTPQLMRESGGTPDGGRHSSGQRAGRQTRRMAGSLTREDAFRTVGRERAWDVIVVGGGATGLGTAVEAAARGYKTPLFEAEDFGKGTSSRSTKLVHGGVRYLQQGNVKLVLEALKERGRML